MQWPPTQLVPTGHWCPQEPQFIESLVMLTSQPSLYCPLQSTNPGLHWVMWQLPPAQLTADAFAGRVHDVTHVPQWLTLVCVLTSQPLLYCPSQSAKPAAQAVIWHVFIVHVAEVTFAVGGQSMALLH
jgi:hypothetical protein